MEDVCIYFKVKGRCYYPLTLFALLKRYTTKIPIETLLSKVTKQSFSEVSKAQLIGYSIHVVLQFETPSNYIMGGAIPKNSFIYVLTIYETSPIYQQFHFHMKYISCQLMYSWIKVLAIFIAESILIVFPYLEGILHMIIHHSSHAVNNLWQTFFFYFIVEILNFSFMRLEQFQHKKVVPGNLDLTHFCI